MTWSPSVASWTSWSNSKFICQNDQLPGTVAKRVSWTSASSVLLTIDSRGQNAASLHPQLNTHIVTVPATMIGLRVRV
jgi:hypothetical protein